MAIRTYQRPRGNLCRPVPGDVYSTINNNGIRLGQRRRLPVELVHTIQKRATRRGRRPWGGLYFEDRLPGRRELGDGGHGAPSDHDIAVGERLIAALGPCLHALGVVELVQDRNRLFRVIQTDAHAPRAVPGAPGRRLPVHVQDVVVEQGDVVRGIIDAAAAGASGEADVVLERKGR